MGSLRSSGVVGLFWVARAKIKATTNTGISPLRCAPVEMTNWGLVEESGRAESIPHPLQRTQRVGHPEPGLPCGVGADQAPDLQVREIGDTRLILHLDHAIRLLSEQAVPSH